MFSYNPPYKYWGFVLLVENVRIMKRDIMSRLCYDEWHGYLKFEDL